MFSFPPLSTFRTKFIVQNYKGGGGTLKKPKNKGGRPPKHQEGRLSKNRTFRVRGSLDEYLSRAAAEAGRSVSEEIEARLGRSFYLDDVLSTAVGTRAQLIKALAAAVTAAERTVSWHDYEGKAPTLDAYALLKAAASSLIDAFSGHGETFLTYAEVDAKIEKGIISEAEGNYKKMGDDIALEILRDLGLVQLKTRGNVTEILKSFAAQKMKEKVK
jgi:hypothetical protein